jgi:thiol-disulfide isomerase/thioredoxin
MGAIRVGALAAVVTLAPCVSASAAGPTPGSGPTLLAVTAAEVLQAVRAPGARVVLVNVWASWCLPCREEMPGLLRLRRAYAERGLRLILVSGDFSRDADQAVAFLREQNVDFPSYIKKGPDTELIDAFDPDWSGALPATFIYDGQGNLRHAIHGQASYEQLEEKVRDVLSG